MKVLVTGAAGMLAHELVPVLGAAGHEVVALDRSALDVSDAAAVRRQVIRSAPDAVVQCAAYTAVDAAESDADAAFLVNADATRYVAEACHEAGALFVFPSTDYVFRGDGSRPYRPEDPTDPINVYGRSKLAGEQAALEVPGALVVRTSWLYGRGGQNFVETMLRLGRERDRLQVVDDQEGRPTWTRTLARVLCGLLEKQAPGIFHATDGGATTTWYRFACQIMQEASNSVTIEPVAFSAFPRPAPRPGYSVLDCSATEATLGWQLPDWRESLRQYVHGHPSDKE
jgi:dTDP-4-dehydrorhamnose reductase